jgi:phosphotransacetylase
MQRDASVNDVVNMTAIAVAEAQRRERASQLT